MKACALLLLLSACARDGAPAVEAWQPPANPHLAASAWAIFHHDSYAQHYSTLPGPTGKNVGTTVTSLDGLPIFVLFDPDENILVVTKKLSGATLWKIDRATLTPIASAPLTASGVFSGTYGYIDAQGRAVFGIGRTVERLASTATSLDVEASVDLSATVAADDSLVAISVL